MQFDIITIFPEFFDALDISLVGKAKQSGLISTRVHNLRDWASGKHLAVDDTPAGGGAGMVMLPDVWGSAIDDVLEREKDVAKSKPDATNTHGPKNGPALGSNSTAKDTSEAKSDGDVADQSAATTELAAQGTVVRQVLAIPTPSGAPLTQERVQNLAEADQLIIACGRYEGIDARVAEHYRTRGVEVVEFSLGDYVLNGGEVAALALVEATSRLIDGVIGNPESLEEESHGPAGLLEYPVFTGPKVWRDLRVPAVLSSGHHGNIARYRRDEALRKTLKVRPDLIGKINPETLGSRDREVLADEGLALRPRQAKLAFYRAQASDLEEISALATELFPLACPPGTPQDEIDGFTGRYLTVEALRKNIEEEGGRICYATAKVGAEPERIVGYTLMFPTIPDPLGTAPSDSCYLSKIYASKEWQGSGVSGALLNYALADAIAAWEPSRVALGTNRANKGAIRFYRKRHFHRAGTRTFEVGGREHLDFVFVRDLTSHPLN